MAHLLQILQKWKLLEYATSLSSRISAKDTPFQKLKLLGQGGRAYVFWLSDRKRVLKLTSDETDALACVLLGKHPANPIVRVYDVFRFGSTPYYGIVSEKLTPLAGAEYTEWRDISKIITEDADLYDLPVWQGLTKTWVQETKEAIPDLAEAAGQAFANTFRVYLWQLEKGQESLQQRGILWSDLTADNIMYRGRSLVISDVGRSRISRPPRIPKLEIH